MGEAPAGRSLESSMPRPLSREPQARRRFSLDPRLVIGVLLVAGSISAVVGIVAAADATTEVYAASDVLAPGDLVTASDLELRSVRLDDALGLYLTPGDIPSDGVIVSRSVLAGELLPASAVGSESGSTLASIVLSSGALAASVVPGAVVDVWAAREGESGQFGPPAVLAPNAVVVRLVESSSLVGGGGVTGVEVLVPRTKIARVLESIANNDAMSIVPDSVPVGR